VPTERIKVNLSDAADIATQKFFRLLDVASWDKLKNKIQSAPASGKRASRKQRLAEAKNRKAQLFGGSAAAQEAPVGASEKPLDELFKELVEGT
jgi:hypothetical protein